MDIHNDILKEFCKELSSDFKEIVGELFAIIVNILPTATYAIKWKQLTFAMNNDFHHWLVSINITKKYIGLNFHFGGILNDTENILIAGKSKFLRKMEFYKKDDINVPILVNLLEQANKKFEYFKTNWKELNK